MLKKLETNLNTLNATCGTLCEEASTILEAQYY